MRERFSVVVVVVLFVALLVVDWRATRRGIIASRPELAAFAAFGRNVRAAMLMCWYAIDGCGFAL